MATLSEVGPGSFDAYEGIRIVIPGVLTYGVVVATFKTVAPSENVSVLDNPFTSIVAALAIGLMLYFLDIPARAAAYGKNQPTDHLNKEFPDISSGELLTAYFLLLNTRMPSNTRNRALYMGSMFRIGIEMILVVSVASSVVFGAAMMDYGEERAVFTNQAHRLAAAFMVVVFVLSFWANTAYTSSKFWGRIKQLLRGFRSWSILIYGIGIGLIAAPILTAHFDKLPWLRPRYVAAIGLTISVAYWVRRYIRGDSTAGRGKVQREPLDSSFAGLLYLLPLLLALTLYLPAEKSVLYSAGYVIGWTVAASVVIALVVIRGHERKLHGVYRGQTRWLKDNHEEVTRFLEVSSAVAATGPPPVRVEIQVAEVNVNTLRLRMLRSLRQLFFSER